MIHRQSAGWLTAAILIATCLSALAAANSAGRITTAIGTGNIFRGAHTLPAEKGAVLGVGDRLHTPADSKLQWWMEDDSIGVMASNSDVELRDYRPSARQAKYGLQRGGMRIVSGTLPQTIVTPVASVIAQDANIAIFFCNAACAQTQGNAALQGLYVRADKGRAVVRNAGGEKVSDKGQIVFVDSASTPPRLIDDMPPVFALVLLELELEFTAGTDLVPDVPIQPLPPAELPGSPS